MRLTRLVTVLMASGLALLALAVALSLMSASAATCEARYDTSAYRYTAKPSAAAMVNLSFSTCTSTPISTVRASSVEAAPTTPDPHPA